MDKAGGDVAVTFDKEAIRREVLATNHHHHHLKL